MILVDKQCNNCEEINEKVWIPKDMVDDSFQCPYCEKGTVSYKEIRSFRKENESW